MAKNKEIVVSPKPQYELSNSQELHNLAIELNEYVHKLNLCVNIQGKQYPLVEAWQFAGSRLGLLPIIRSVTNQSTDTEIKYMVDIDLINSQKEVIGRGIATCSNKEKNKRYFEEYAICSMAQTRAIGKAYRNTLAWIMKSAGYEPTPAEEMDFAKTENSKHSPSSAEISDLTSKIENAKTIEDLKEAWKEVQNNWLLSIDECDKLKAAKDKMKIILSDKNNNNAFNLGGNI